MRAYTEKMHKSQAKEQPSPPRLRSRRQLVASLEALLANDDVDLDILRPGAPWPSATEISQLSQTSSGTQYRPAAALCPPEDSIAIDPALGGDFYHDGLTLDLDQSWLTNLVNGDALSEEQADSFMATPAPTSITPSASIHDGSNTTTDSCSNFSSMTTGRWNVPLDSVYSGPAANMTNSQPQQLESRGPKTPESIDVSRSLGLSRTASERDSTPAFQRWASKATNADEATGGSGQALPRKRQHPHYAIEKRYRAGLQEHFEALRDCVSSFKQRENEQQSLVNGDDVADWDDRADSKDGSSRMNKAEVLSQATIYIQQLQEENEAAIEHIKLLIKRLRLIKGALVQA